MLGQCSYARAFVQTSVFSFYQAQTIQIVPDLKSHACAYNTGPLPGKLEQEQPHNSG